MATTHRSAHIDPDRPPVVIVGAGPAGIGVASALTRVGVSSVILEREEVGASFRRWPEGMRLITPSFPGNQFGAVDLNAVTPDTSPALALMTEHPTGPEYADYLGMVVDLDRLSVTCGVDVTGIEPIARGLRVTCRGERVIEAPFVVWAGGEAAYPSRNGFAGAEWCVHTIRVRSWDAHPGDDVVVIGGYESGIDAAVNLVDRGRRVTVLDREAPWEVADPDPSRALSPHTFDRLVSAHATGQLVLEAGVAVEEVAPAARHGYQVRASDGRTWRADGPPLMATGFAGSLGLVQDRFAFESGRVVVTEEADESTVTPGLFLAGPALAHRGAIFCFVYKFRQRFGVVARAIGQRLGMDTTPLEALGSSGFLLDDLSCCDDCAC